MRLVRTSDETSVWEGRATAEAPDGSERAALGTLMPSLAADLLRDFPGPSGETVTYRD